MPEITIPRAGSQVIDPVFSRLDKCEAFVEFNDDNHNFLSDPERFWDLILYTDAMCGGTGGNYRPGREAPTAVWTYKIFRSSWQIVIRGALMQVTISFPRTFQSLLPHERRGPVDYRRELNPVDRDAVLPILQSVPLPPMEELWRRGWDMNYKKRFLGWIRFADRFKECQRPYYNQWHAFSYRRNIRYVLELWEEHDGILLLPKTLEVAMDTWDSCKGAALIRNFLPPWFNPDYLYHFDGSRRKRLGPSPDGGNHEYSSYTRSGRKVHHSYVKEVRRWDRKLYRVETQFHRTFLREYCSREGITRTSNLLDRVPDMAAGNVRFATLDRDKLFSKNPCAQKWKLRRLSTRGQIYVLQLRHGMSRRQISKYLIPLEETPVTDHDVWAQY